ncbi:hypothetical protein PsorP6_015081 [Peronosclerospora sorghi]|uniref:Uncharacterized protein n=1 Tax=Peronosclerospora sorghi TaxID=230839 RepID=A0ACC0VSQ2_9STRA|nr:hypothetical protein PsorP6_015081 [Peronosclerospora sorghi]
MSFPLLEDDDEAAFTDLLASLDEYTEAFDAPLEYNGRSATSSSTWHDPISETCAWAAFDAAHPLPQTTSKHRNGAREMRRREVHYLRTCVKGLQAQLSALHATIERRAQQRTRSGWEDSPTASSALVTIWKDLAARQLDQRLASERENTRLKCALEDQRKVREMLQRVLNTRVARRVRNDELNS